MTTQIRPDAAARPATRLRDLPFRGLGGQPPFEPDDIEPFVDARRIGVLAYVRSDGRPNQSPLWYTLRDGVIHMTTTTGSAKHRALERDPRVTFTIQDEAPPYRAVIVDGTVELRDLGPDPADDPTEGMAVRYFGRVAAAAYHRMAGDSIAAMTLISLTPTELKGFDNANALSTTENAFVRVRERLPIPRPWL
ncbi:MAG: PPOX class F420-dependent oxidoreductase [Actinomycetota bacterium]|nr:PPOX class F420-dependent oxidoreductase [Actinomycetota bacterium]